MWYFINKKKVSLQVLIKPHSYLTSIFNKLFLLLPPGSFFALALGLSLVCLLALLALGSTGRWD
jgi:hypothetical protein